MKEASPGLVRYHGKLVSPAMAGLLRASVHHRKARQYAPRGTDPASVSPTVADLQRPTAALSPEHRALRDRLAITSASRR